MRSVAGARALIARADAHPGAMVANYCTQDSSAVPHCPAGWNFQRAGAARYRVAIVFVTASRSLIDSPIVWTYGPAPGSPLRHAATRAF